MQNKSLGSCSSIPKVPFKCRGPDGNVLPPWAVRRQHELTPNQQWSDCVQRREHLSTVCTSWRLLSAGTRLPCVAHTAKHTAADSATYNTHTLCRSLYIYLFIIVFVVHTYYVLVYLKLKSNTEFLNNYKITRKKTVHNADIKHQKLF